MDPRDSKTAIRDQIAASAVGEHLQKRLREGDPTLGWAGDPWLTLCWNKLESCWEVWDERPERPVRVKRSITLLTPAIGQEQIVQLLIHLRDHDFRNFSIEEQIERIDKHNESVEAAQHYASSQKTLESLEKVYWGAAKDLGEKNPFAGYKG